MIFLVMAFTAVYSTAILWLRHRFLSEGQFLVNACLLEGIVAFAHPEVEPIGARCKCKGDRLGGDGCGKPTTGSRLCSAKDKLRTSDGLSTASLLAT